MKQLISILAIAAILFSACTGNSKKGNEQANTDAEMYQAEDSHHHDNGEDMLHHDQEMGSDMGHHMDSSPMTVQESRATSMVIDAYLKIKNALVADNDKEAAKSGKDLVNAFNNIDKSSVSGEKMSEFKEIIEDAKGHADHISENKGNIEHQREHFKMLSTDIIDLIAIAGADRTLYQIYCPMYDNQEGGSWLSASDEIQNPFYGSKMSNCGEVKSKISVQ
jgi:hypothetical protein